MSTTNPYAPKESSESNEVEAQEVESNETEEQKLEVPSGTVSEVTAWVNGDKDRAEAALEAEKAGANRVTLIHALEEVLDKK